MKALALFSGGLDSALSIKIVQAQGIEVIPLNFVSYFFGGVNERAAKMSEQLGTTISYVDFKEAHLKIVENPPNGYGKKMNPCIDCHALMIKTALSLLPEYDASFVITGEVLGQRPMSQTVRSINKINSITGNTGLVVRPLSAKLLPVTKAEANGWIDREKLLDISGRGRKVQMALAEKYGIIEYPSPAGGCALTEEGYSSRLHILKEDGMFAHRAYFAIIKAARFLRLGAGKYVLISRNEQENEFLDNYIKEVDHYIVPAGNTYGPHVLMIGKGFTDDEMEYLFRLFSRYSKGKGKAEVDFTFDGALHHYAPCVVDDAEMERYLIK